MRLLLQRQTVYSGVNVSSSSITCLLLLLARREKTSLNALQHSCWQYVFHTERLISRERRGDVINTFMIKNTINCLFQSWHRGLHHYSLSYTEGGRRVFSYIFEQLESTWWVICMVSYKGQWFYPTPTPVVLLLNDHGQHSSVNRLFSTQKAVIVTAHHYLIFIHFHVANLCAILEPFVLIRRHKR